MQTGKTLLQRIIRNKKTLRGAFIFFIGYTLTAFALTYGRHLNINTLNAQAILNFCIKAIPLIITFIGLGYFLLGYLEGHKTEDSWKGSSGTDFQNVNEIQKDLKSFFLELRHNQEKNKFTNQEIIQLLTHQIHEQKEFHFDEKQKLELLETLKQSFAENINKDFFKELSDNISIEVTKEKRSRLELLIKDFNLIKIRLNREIDKLERKANVNLVIGSLTTIIALLSLGLVVFQNNAVSANLTDILYHYIPRLSLIIFIEVFAYFFLRLYKLNLNDMKYFQNELTTVELKLVSISTAINFGKDTDISAIAIEISKTERNFILKRGETTVELEKSRIDKTDLKEILKPLTDIVKREK